MEREGFLQRIQWQKPDILWTTVLKMNDIRKNLLCLLWTKRHGKHVQYMDVKVYYGRIFFCFSLIILPSKIWHVLILNITWNLLLPVHFQILDLLAIRAIPQPSLQQAGCHPHKQKKKKTIPEQTQKAVNNLRRFGAHPNGLEGSGC